MLRGLKTNIMIFVWLLRNCRNQIMNNCGFLVSMFGIQASLYSCFIFFINWLLLVSLYMCVCVCVKLLMMASTMTKQWHNGCKWTKIYIVEDGCHNDRYDTKCFYNKCTTCIYVMDNIYSSKFMKIYMYYLCYCLYEIVYLLH